MTNSLKKRKQMIVSVVVRRMYYWDSLTETAHLRISGFSSCQKNVLLGLVNGFFYSFFLRVSVVVRRMYYWDAYRRKNGRNAGGFSSCQKNVLLGPSTMCRDGAKASFSSCQKNVLLGQTLDECLNNIQPVSVVVRRMYYWDPSAHALRSCQGIVSVVVRRMYYWDYLRRHESSRRRAVSVVVRRMYYWDS